MDSFSFIFIDLDLSNSQFSILAKCQMFRIAVVWRQEANLQVVRYSKARVQMEVPKVSLL